MKKAHQDAIEEALSEIETYLVRTDATVQAAVTAPAQTISPHLFERKQAMLDATIYAQALNLAIENGRAAVAHRDEQNAERFIAQFCHIINYCGAHGLTLDTFDLDAGFRLKRNGMEPAALHILIDGQDGWAYRTCAVDTRYYEPVYESNYHWEERRAIERDYIELRPW